MDRADWTPSVADVGAYLRARTVDDNNVEQGTFNSQTRPTGTEVEDLIDTAVARVYGRCGTIPDQVEDWARRLAAMGAAALVEQSFFPEQSRSSDSSFAALKEWFDEGIIELKERVDAINADSTPDDTTDDELFAVGSFPVPCDDNALIGWSSRW